MSIFALKTSPEQLKSSNDGVSNFNYVEYTPSRDVTGSNFPNGRFVIPYEINSETWWIPSRSYMRIRCKLTKGDDSPLFLSNNVAPNMNLASNLFQSLELQLNGKTISRCSDNVAQVDTLEQRLHQSKAWLDSIGASINWLQESVDDRMNAVSVNGTENTGEVKFITSWDNPAFGFVPTTVIKLNEMSVVPTAGGTVGKTTLTISGEVTDEGNITAAIFNAFTDIIKVGDHIVFESGDNFYSCVINGPIEYAGTLGDTDAVISIPVNLGPTPDPTTETTFENAFNRFVIKRPMPSRRITGFELIWKPMCLSVFKYGGALPVGKYELICTPHNASGDNYKIRAIEVPQYVQKASIPTFGTTAANIKFEVDSVRFYAAQVVGERVEDMTYYIDLENTRLQTAQMQITTSLAKEYFNVSPLTYALTVAYQDVDAGIDSRRSSSRFKVADVVNSSGIVTLEDPELKLNRLFLQYAGKSFPQPDADPSFKETSAEDYTTQRYVETSINSGAFFSEGGGESIQDWQKRGAYHYFSTPKDGQDRSTRLTVNQMFSADFANKSRLLLFDHSSAMVKVTIQRGLITSVECLDA